MRRKLTKARRDELSAKWGNRCAYCGHHLGARWHVDHREALRRGGADAPDNLMPSCAPCNNLKATLTVEEFRERIAHQVDRLRRESRPWRVAERYGLAEATGKPVAFFFERGER